ncbi:MAG: hypothetical protein MUE74_05530 [Bacteroidales bacterium]|nr:hypothetical protein [Bacteroidales bacterium]
MKRSAYKPGKFLAAALLLTAAALQGQEVSKDFSKEYKADKNSTLEIDNKYGDVIIEASQTDRIVISVKATVKYPNQERAERYLSYIDVQFSEEGNDFKAETRIDDKFRFSGWSSESRRFTIDYLVKMPPSLALTVYNIYGDVELDDMTGYVRADVRYGSLTAGKLTRGNEKPLNEINVAYSKAFIGEAGWLNLTSRYSPGLTVNKAQALLLDSKYSTLNLGTISSIVGESDYDGRFKIEEINNLVIEADYSHINVSKLNNKLVLDAGYGSFNTDYVSDKVETIDVKTRYTSVRLGFSSEASYKLDAKLSYGGLKYNEENFRSIRRITGNTSTELSGLVGKAESPKALVKIDGSYASVKLY